MSERSGPTLDSEEALSRTLRTLGIDETLDREVLAFSPPDLAVNGNTYAAVNDDLGRLVAGGPVEVTHVTGEARALVDPAHRRVLRRVRERGDRATLGCHFMPDHGKVDAWGFLAKQRHHWERAQWYDIVDVLSLIAEGAVDVRVMRAPAPVHFSLFADDRVLMQDEHHHPTKKKWVWYLSSLELAERLRPVAARAFEEAKPLRPDDCRVLLHWMYSYDVYATLQAVKAGDAHVAGDVDNPDAVTAELEELGFVAGSGGAVGLSRLGRQWLDEYESDD